MIHQIWWQGESQIPQKYHKYQDAMRAFLKANPLYEHRMWDEASCLKLIQELFPQCVKVLDTLKLVEKCDMARLAILFKYGGVYLDMDFMILPNFGEFVDRFDSPNHRTVFQQEPLGLTNCVILSTPKNPVMELLFQECVDRAQHPSPWGWFNENLKTLETTGPHMVTKALHVKEFADNVRFLYGRELERYGRHCGEGDWVDNRGIAKASEGAGSVINSVVQASHAVSQTYVETVRHEGFLPGLFLVSIVAAAVSPSVWVGALVIVALLYLDLRMYVAVTDRAPHNHLAAVLPAGMGLLVGRLLAK